MSCELMYIIKLMRIGKEIELGEERIREIKERDLRIEKLGRKEIEFIDPTFWITN